MSKITNDGLSHVWHRMLYSGTNMATVSIRSLSNCSDCLAYAFTLSQFLWFWYFTNDKYQSCLLCITRAL